eukprot:COSAG06_NODE_115_length_23358_cov_31.775227_24_plen_326_part_00
MWKTTRSLEERAPVKHCFAVAKDGVLVSETYYINNTDARIEMDSAGKTVTALLIGVLVKQYSLSLDSTLKELGVVTDSSWGTPTAAAPEGEYWPRVTIRHILGQTSGIGKYEPGTEFTYDSDDYLQHLVKLIEAVTKGNAKDFATEHFAVPMGIPDLYTWDMYTTLEARDITAGGGQFVTCTELLRFGQLILNKGRWPAKDVCENGSLEPFIGIHAIILPRQARDEQRESTQKKTTVFSGVRRQHSARGRGIHRGDDDASVPGRNQQLRSAYVALEQGRPALQLLPAAVALRPGARQPGAARRRRRFCSRRRAVGCAPDGRVTHD